MAEPPGSPALTPTTPSTKTRRRVTHLVCQRLSGSAWGIDLGPSGLKAVKLTENHGGGGVVVEEYDFQEHRKPLSQTLNKAEEQNVIDETLTTFLSRNQIKGSQICVGLPGLMVLCRPLQLPPMPEAKLAAAIQCEMPRPLAL